MVITDSGLVAPRESVIEMLVDPNTCGHDAEVAVSVVVASAVPNSEYPDTIDPGATGPFSCDAALTCTAVCDTPPPPASLPDVAL